MGMADATGLWRQLLQIQEPWTVRECRADEFNRCMEIRVGVEAPRGWFRLGRSTAAGEEFVWRHIGFGDWRVRLSVIVPQGSEPPRHAWAGEVGMPFTRALDREVLALLGEGVGMTGVCSLLDIPMSELWRYRHAIDNGKLSVDAYASSKAVPAPAANEPAGSASSRVPDVADPVWQRLVEGSLEIDVRVLGLQMLLSRLRSQAALIADEQVRAVKLRELHRYFVRNERMLAHELGQMSLAEAA